MLHVRALICNTNTLNKKTKMVSLHDVLYYLFFIQHEKSHAIDKNSLEAQMGSFLKKLPTVTANRK
jgi:hypothetical protein